ncbi:replication restart helicase PriA [Pedobacter endophyticus]|uniref:Replication restart protein PriA n=1 Tax=Pedobacter endophyticus TaxID=2789740 RepID=A0A7S9KZL6_9SPHI|nr:primosomal protein N' [Pedobacter endophyticus]QPH39750.1 primosomal protein N' [Pedobacter endophyticus]
MDHFESDIFTERETLFVEVILPLSLAKNYTYRVPFELNNQIEIGKRVVVQFGKHKIYAALISAISTRPPTAYEAKYIIDIIDAEPVITPTQLQFWDWMTNYYMCNEGDVMAAALPASLKLASETILVLRDDFSDEIALTEKEEIIISTLKKQQKLTVNDVSKLLGQKTIYPIINNLLEKELILVAEEVVQKYKPLLKSFVMLNDFYADQENLKELFSVLERAPKQLDALLAYLKLQKANLPIAKEQLLEESNCGPAALKALTDKEIFVITKRPVSRLAAHDEEFSVNFQLNDAQQSALHQINKAFEEKDVVLLHGVTASGKTQVYIKLIEEIVQNSTGQVLFLLPEIALTTQIVERIKRYFGNAIGVYHSKFNNSERVEIWNKVRTGAYKVILGARSAVFLPFQNLKLVVVDEEHEPSYKQYDPAPRYQARDASIYLAHLHQAKVILGSATPSLESYYNALQGKYGFVTMKERFGGVQLPNQQVVSIAEETKRKTMVSYFSSVLIKDIDQALSKKEQIVLFQNRRGYATILICATCGYTPKCVNCDVSLTYHKSSGKLHCHYCGFQQSSVNICPACGSVHVEQKGFGTERIEEELKLLYPDVNIARLDMDSTRTKNGLQQILNDFQEKKTDILIGTQMVAKGLDFDNLNLIGVINADTLLGYPDFRAYERSFQLLAQVAGRAGRRADQGNVCIQTYDAENRIIKQVVNNDYEGMYNDEIAERERFLYPPFSRMIFLYVKHKDAHILDHAALNLANILKAKFGKRVLGPEQPLVSRVRNMYIKQIIIKADKHTAIQKVKDALRQTLTEFNATKEFKGVLTQIDVDPY